MSACGRSAAMSFEIRRDRQHPPTSQRSAARPAGSAGACRARPGRWEPDRRCGRALRRYRANRGGFVVGWPVHRTALHCGDAQSVAGDDAREHAPRQGWRRLRYGEPDLIEPLRTPRYFGAVIDVVGDAYCAEMPESRNASPPICGSTKKPSVACDRRDGRCRQHSRLANTASAACSSAAICRNGIVASLIFMRLTSPAKISLPAISSPGQRAPLIVQPRPPYPSSPMQVGFVIASDLVLAARIFARPSYGARHSQKRRRILDLRQMHSGRGKAEASRSDAAHDNERTETKKGSRTPTDAGLPASPCGEARTLQGALACRRSTAALPLGLAHPKVRSRTMFRGAGA